VGRQYLEHRRPPPTAREDLAAARDADGNVLAIGGYDGDDTVDTVARWDGSTWSTVESLPTARRQLAATFFG